MLIGCRPEEHEALIRGVTGIKLAISRDCAANVIPVSSSKGTSIAKVLKHFHLNASQAMAFGDSYNDIEMLQAAGTGIATGNAIGRLKEIADDICGSVAEDGIYYYCIENGLI